jgi:hypothetical protein
VLPAFLLVAVLVPASLVAGAEKLELPEGFSLWQKSLSVRAGFGYNDNVTLSSFAPVGSPFVQASGDLMLFRLPWNNWQFSFFANGSDARFLNRDTGVDTDQQATASAQLTWFLGKGWKTISTAQYVFLNQVMDVSAEYDAATRQQVFAQGVTGIQGVRKDLGRFWAEVNLSGSRYFVRQPLDSYWQGGPEAKLGMSYGKGSELAIGYQVTPVAYDTREQVDPVGAPVTGTHLQFVLQTAGVTWQHFWDEKRRWRSTTRLGYDLNRDNGSGYYDYSRYQLTEQLRFRPAHWEFSAQIGLCYYDFPNQSGGVSRLGNPYRTDFRAALRAERGLSQHWKIYAEYSHERSFSGVAAEDYEANVGSAGIEFAL